jgi:DNA-directed RNA polymerase subunit RPC12/RpoP
MNIIDNDYDDMNEFCQECGTILDLPEISDYIECNSCNFKMNIKDYKTKEILTTKEYKDKKEWLIEYQ